MQTPAKVTLDQYLQARREFLAQKTLAWPTTGGLQCVECGGAIRGQAAILSVHDLNVGVCAGTGHTMTTAVPYCPACEEVPAARGCLHG